jgi:hypothetical protein
VRGITTREPQCEAEHCPGSCEAMGGHDEAEECSSAVADLCTRMSRLHGAEHGIRPYLASAVCHPAGDAVGSAGAREEVEGRSLIAHRLLLVYVVWSAIDAGYTRQGQNSRSPPGVPVPVLPWQVLGQSLVPCRGYRCVG